MLDTFVIVHNNKIISPVLTTTREYGRYLEELFDQSICQLELYMKSIKEGGERVLEFHPGSRIGHWYDKNKFQQKNLQSWFLYQDSTMMDKICKHKLAEYKDAIPIAVNDEKGRRMLRCYTVDQIELYVKSNIDKSFKIEYSDPKQIKIRDTDFEKMIIPQIKQGRRRLF